MRKLSLKSKITITSILLLTITLAITAIISGIFISANSERHIIAAVESNVNDYSNQINSWLESEITKLESVGNDIRYHKYDTANRSKLYKYLVKNSL